MLPALFEVILPAFVVVSVGAYLGRAFRPQLLEVNRLALYAAVPALVFTSLATTEVDFRNASLLLSGNALFMVVMALLAWLSSWRFAAAKRRGLVATSIYGNAANLMLPVTLFAFGEAGLQRALILYVFSSLMQFTTGPLVLGGSNAGTPLRRRQLLAGVLKMPVLWAALLGVAVNLAGVAIPLGLARGVELLGDAAIPLVLLALGIQVQQTGLKLPAAVNLHGSALKLLVGPFVGFTAAYLIGARGLDLAVLTLLGAMPPAVNNFMLALEFGADAKEVAGTVIVSTMSSVLTLSLVVSVLQRYLG